MSSQPGFRVMFTTGEPSRLPCRATAVSGPSEVPVEGPANGSTLTIDELECS